MKNKFSEFMRWAGETVAIVASGPSLTKQDVDHLRGRCRVITVNTSFRIAPWADVHYSNDDDWFMTYKSEMRAHTTGEQWCGHPTYNHDGLHKIEFDKQLESVSMEPGVIAWGGNSGFAAINLAAQFGASRILLLGFDHGWDGGKCHHHGKHPAHLQNKKPGFHRWTPYHVRAARDLAALGVEVINCTRKTGLTCYKQAKITDVLK